MGKIRDKILAKLEELSRCPRCRHTNPRGVDGCPCPLSDCACNPTNWP